ncbi:MAG: hypothetical protein ACJ8AT_11355 [Hyalangium sp.]|uniref:hypothetical protein n=1 Tax=Hyalangium sp. TaxID=2028555 RepID=UPI00389AD284
MKKLLGSLVLLSLVACSGSTDQVGVSVRMGAPRTGAATTRQQALTVATGLDITRVRMVISRLDLRQEGEDETKEQEDLSKVEAGPFLVDLSSDALSGQISQVLETSVAAGHYDKLEIKIHKVDDSKTQGDARFADLVQKDASVIVDGKIDGADFTFVTSVDEKQERKAAFDVGTTAQNITLNVDITKWFTGSNGQRLDPRESSNRSAIEENIKNSIDAFDDHDRDGAEDHDDDGSGSGDDSGGK